MANLNKVMLMGNLTRDPDLKYTPKGSAVVELGLAINRSYTTDSGEKRDETTFVDITFWGKQAEVLKQYLTKGRPLYVEGRLQLDTWDDKQSGQKRSKLRVHGESFQFLGGRQGGNENQQSGGSDEYSEEPRQASTRPAQRPSAPRPRPSDPDLDPADDDIPF